MTYNFDEIIDRRSTNAMNVEGYLPYLFGNADVSDLQHTDDLIRLWIKGKGFLAPGHFNSLMDSGHGFCDT